MWVAVVGRDGCRTGGGCMVDRDCPPALSSRYLFHRLSLTTQKHKPTHTPQLTQPDTFPPEFKPTLSNPVLSYTFPSEIPQGYPDCPITTHSLSEGRDSPPLPGHFKYRHESHSQFPLMKQYICETLGSLFLCVSSAAPRLMTSFNRDFTRDFIKV